MKLKSPAPIAAADYQRLIRLWETAGLTHKPNGRDSQAAITQQIEDGYATFMGVETEQGELVGSVLATHDGRRGWINRLSVHPDYRRQGIGMRLVWAAEEQLKMQGIGIIAALIEPDNEDSLELFKKADYVEWPGLHYVSKRERSDI